MSRSRRRSVPAAATALLWFAVGLGAQEHVHTGEHDSVHANAEEHHGVPIYDNLGSHHYAITTDEPVVQAYFDQGLRLYYAFNHQEAIRSFRAAQSVDPGCAMCYWGEALAWGPNINLPMDEAGAEAAFAAVTKARTLLAGVSESERALIEALATRYSEVVTGDRAALDLRYMEAMSAVSERFPNDVEAAVLHAEAVMTTRPWDYWTEEGEPHEYVGGALEKLVDVLNRDRNHPGACHFLIHAVEKLYPERAVACAERLADLMPGAGHLVHMPGHIYIRVGRYEDAIAANEHAVHADESYIQDQRPGLGVYTAGYYPHNYDFLAFAASMIGRADQAIEATRRIVEVIPTEMMGEEGFTFLQHYGTRVYQLLVRFSRWDEILEEPAPNAELTYARAMWEYAQGRAKAAAGDLGAARVHLNNLRTAAYSSEFEGVVIEPNEASKILQIADRVLGGWIAAESGDMEAAVRELRAASNLEDQLLYGEPPEWTVPVRHDLGAVLLRAGDYSGAEAIFRGDLERFPENGWSLRGLEQALEGQGRTVEAAEVGERFRAAWSGRYPSGS